MLDDKFNMVEYVKSVFKSSYNQLYQISQIRKYLTQEAAATIIYSLVISILDSLHALIYEQSVNMIHKFPLIQNHADCCEGKEI